jgi:hypothetical protein
VVCPTPRDRAHFSHPEIRSAHDLEFWGTDEATHEPGFDGLRFLRETIRAIEGRRSAYRAVVGIDDFPACLMAALIAEAIGLPSPSFASLFCCQHKYYSRLLQREAAPDAIPAFHLLDPSRSPRPADIPMALPIFIKPVKSYLSILARRIDTIADLSRTVAEARHRLTPIAEMFDGFVGASRLDEKLRAIPGSALIVEELLSGHQVTLDGYVYEGQVVPLGVVDSFFTTNGLSFQRFEYPSRIPAGVQERMARIAERCIRRIGLDRTFFNVEFFYRPEDDAIRLVEINGRMASQFAPLYRMVDGIDLYAMQLDLALGRNPDGRQTWAPGRKRGPVAASFVLRRFENGVVTQIPGPDDLERFAQRFPEAFVEILVKEGGKLSDELQDDYSFRYALVNLRAPDRNELQENFAEARKLLPFAFGPIASRDHQSELLPVPRPLSAPAPFKGPAEPDRRYHSGDQDHHHHGREDSLRQNRLPADRQSGSDSRKDQTDLAAGDHPDGNGETVQTAPNDPECRCQLPGERANGQDDPEAKHHGTGETPEMDLDTYQHEEEGNKEARQRMQELRQCRLLLRNTDPLSIGIEHQSGRKGPDDAGQPHHLCRKSERKTQPQAEDQHHLWVAGARHQTNDLLREEHSDRDRDSEEDDRTEEDPGDREEREARSARRDRRHHPRHHRQHHQPKDVIQDRRTEDNLPLSTLHHAKIPQDSHGDRNAGGRKGGPYEDMNEGRAVGKEPCRGAPPQQDGDYDPDCGHEEGRQAHSGQRPQVGLQPYIEEEDQHPDLGQDQQRRIRADEGNALPSEKWWEEIAEHDPDQQFPEDRRLPPPFGQQTPDLRRDHQHGQPKQDWTGSRVPVRARRPRESRTPDG